MSRHSILCGFCKSPAKTVPNPTPNDKVICSGCGREDRFDDVMRSVQKHLSDSVAKSLNASLAKVASRSKFIKVTKQFRTQGSHRWISTNAGV